MQFLGNKSLRFKLVLTFFLVSLVPFFICAWVVFEKSKIILETQLVDRREAKAHEIEENFVQLKKQVHSVAGNKATVDAMEGFTKGYDQYLAEVKDQTTEAERLSSLKRFYQADFSSQYASKNGGQESGINKRFSKLKPTAVALQYNYISNNNQPLGSKDKLGYAKDGSYWSDVHKNYHPVFSNLIEDYGYYDIFLVEPVNHNIVYSTYKEADFATSLKSGPYSDTNFAEVVATAFNSKSDEVFFSDLASYYPSYNAAAGFVASAILKNSEVIGVLVYQIPVAVLDKILTSNGKWRERGEGETGETYIVSKDMTMRTSARPLLEKPEEFYLSLKESGYSEAVVNKVKARGETAVILSADSPIAKEAVSGETGYGKFKDYRNHNVFSSYSPLKIKGVEWYIISQMDSAEAWAYIWDITQSLVMLMLVTLIAITVFSWLLASKISNGISSRIVDLEDSIVNTTSSNEYMLQASKDVSSSTASQADAIQETVSTLNEITAMGESSVKYANQSTEKAEDSFKITAEGQKVVSDMEQSMKDIADSNKDIMAAISESNDEMAKIVDVINSIADKTNVINDIVFQTKLLSFNASVEAARAGEHGKGFAVVAEEVGNLAQMSGTSSKEISDMLEESIDQVRSTINSTTSKIGELVERGEAKVKDGTVIAKKCGEVLEEVVTNVSEVKSMMSQITLGAKEISEGVGNISNAMNRIDETTHANTDTARKVSDKSHELSDEIKRLTQTANELKVIANGSSDSAILKVPKKNKVKLKEKPTEKNNKAKSKEKPAEKSNKTKPKKNPAEKNNKTLNLVSVKKSADKGTKPSKISPKESSPKKVESTDKKVVSIAKNSAPKPVAKKDAPKPKKDIVANESPAPVKKAVGADFIPSEDDSRFEDV